MNGTTHGSRFLKRPAYVATIGTSTFAAHRDGRVTRKDRGVGEPVLVEQFHGLYGEAAAQAVAYVKDLVCSL